MFTEQVLGRQRQGHAMHCMPGTQEHSPMDIFVLLQKFLSSVNHSQIFFLFLYALQRSHFPLSLQFASPLNKKKGKHNATMTLKVTDLLKHHFREMQKKEL